MKDKITSREIAEKIFYSPATNGKAEESIANGVKLIESYTQQAIQQMLEEVGEALPDDDIIKNQIKKYPAIGTSSFQWGINLAHIAKWMRSESIKVILKEREEKEKYKTDAIIFSEMIGHRDTQITQLADKLASKNEENSKLKMTIKRLQPRRLVDED